ncbi:Heat shock transcription factor, partial [Coemansia sp. RSA 1804]
MADNGSVARRSSNIHRNITITPFLNKLYSMVDDSASDDLIRWSEDGNSFLVINHEEFAKDVLPRFFKHNNFSSFVRQLNMYGFHKVPHLQQGGLAADDPDAESWEFSNDHFQRGQPDLMHFIRRKKGNATNTSAEAPSGDYGDDSYQQEASSNESEDNASSVAETSAATQTAGVRKTAAATAATSKKPRPSRKPPVDLGRVLKEIQVIRDHQMTISADMKRLQSENRSLWMQASAAEERYKRHQATIDKILRFLATVFSPDNQHGEIHPPLRRLISHVSQGKNNVQEAATQGKSTHTGASTPEKRAMPPVSPSPIETLQGGSRSGIYETADSVGAQQPPDKRMRREQPSSSSRITEMPSASPPVYSSKRKVSNPMSTALTRTHLMRPLNELILTGAGSGADANALVTSPNNTYGGLRAQSKSIEQLQSEIDYLGHTPNNLSAAAAALSGL